MPRLALPLLALPVLLAALFAPGAGRADESIRCEGGIVSIGEWKLDLLGKCGEPAFRESKLEEVEGFATTERPRAFVGDRVTVAVERWTYDFGKDRFVGVVTLRLGKVAAVEHGERGHGPGGRVAPRPPIPRARCDYLALREGDRAYDVLGKCGEPALRERGERTHTFAVSDGVGGDDRRDRSSGQGPSTGGAQPRPGPITRGGQFRQGGATSSTVALERWTYDFGPSILTRHLTLEDGVVVEVATGGRGYSETPAP